MRILALGPHPDDAEFGIGGLLIKEAEKGSQVKILVCSLGEGGSKGTPEGRKKESEEAAKIIGADIEFLDFGGDCHIQYLPQNSMVIAKHIRQFKPDILLAPQPQENQHPDHSAVGKIARDAARFARYGGLAELKDLDVHKITALYFYPITQDFGERPDIVIDISDTKDKWLKAIRTHQSQLSGKNYDNLFMARAHTLGSSIGVDLAQGLWVNEPIRLDHVSDIELSSRNY